MRLGVMRFVDRRFGPWLCRVVAFCLWLGRRHCRTGQHPEPPEPDSVREILVLKFMGLGSILQATPLFQALRQRYPRARITLLTFQSNAGLADLGIGVDAVIGVDLSGLCRFVLSNIRTVWRLRATCFDVVLNLEFFAVYAALVTALLRKRFALAFGGYAHHRDAFYDDLVSHEATRHVQGKFLQFARRLGWDGPPPSLARLHVERPASVVGQVEKREGFRLHDHEFTVLVNINTSDLAGEQRRWPQEYFRRVVDDLAARPALRCVLIGGPGERASAERFRASLADPGRVLDLTGRISLRELVAVMQLADLYLGNDSGPMHFAACVGLPVLAFFGPESPAVYGPSTGGRNTVLYRAEPCSPCLNVYSDKHSHCRDNVCMKRIRPEQVLQVLEDRYLPAELPESVGRVALPVVAEALATRST